jgi:hypothetical protein
LSTTGLLFQEKADAGAEVPFCQLGAINRHNQQLVETVVISKDIPTKAHLSRHWQQKRKSACWNGETIRLPRVDPPQCKAAMLTPKPCLPTSAPARRPETWLHEIKHDGYRMLAHHNRERVRLIWRRGVDWGDRFPFIVVAVEGRFGRSGNWLKLKNPDTPAYGRNSRPRLEDENPCRRAIGAYIDIMNRLSESGAARTEPTIMERERTRALLKDKKRGGFAMATKPANAEHRKPTRPKRRNAPTAARHGSSSLAGLQEQVTFLARELAECNYVGTEQACVYV